MIMFDLGHSLVFSKLESYKNANGPCKNQVWYLAQQEIKWRVINRASYQYSPVGIRGETFTIVRPKEHPLSNYTRRFFLDRICRNGRSVINFATIRRFRSIICKVVEPFSVERAAMILLWKFNFSHATSIHLSFV